MEVTLKLDREQAKLVERALDFYGRIHCGQFEEILQIPIKHKDKPIEKCCGYRGGCEDYLIRSLKKELTGMDGASWGISNPELPSCVRTLKDLEEVIRYAISWYDNPKGGNSVSFDKPFHWNRAVPLAEVIIREGDCNVDNKTR